MSYNKKELREVRFITEENGNGEIILNGIEFSDDAYGRVKQGAQPPVRDTVCIPDGVTVIRRAHHPRITSIAIPPSVRKICGESFTVFDGHYTADGYYPMEDDPMGNGHHLTLNTVILSDGLREIGEWAFMNMKAISGIKLPKGLERIEEEAFLGCDGITQIVIPDTVKTLGKGVFDSCTGLKKAIFVGGITELPANLFYNTALTEITLPDTLTRIGNWCFSRCKSLSEIDLPESVEELGRGAFNECSALTSVFFKRDIQSEGDVFSGCAALKQFEFGSGVKNPELLPYAPCVESIAAAKDHPDFITLDGAVYTRDKKTLVRVPHGICGGFTVPRGVTAIGRRAFANCRDLASVTLPGSLESIGEKAFCGCSALTEITLGGKVKRIEDYAFAKCDSVKTVHISASVTEIGEGILLDSGDPEITVSLANPVYTVNHGDIVKKGEN